MYVLSYDSIFIILFVKWGMSARYWCDIVETHSIHDLTFDVYRMQMAHTNLIIKSQQKNPLKSEVSEWSALCVRPST